MHLSRPIQRQIQAAYVRSSSKPVYMCLGPISIYTSPKRRCTEETHGRQDDKAPHEKKTFSNDPIKLQSRHSIQHRDRTFNKNRTST